MNRNELSETFDLARYKQLVAGLVESKFYDETKAIGYSSDVVLDASNIGHFLDDRFRNILVIRHKASISARVKLALDTFKLMAENNIDSALIAYVSMNDPNEWRFSYVSISLDESKGKIKRTFSNPRRYSYVLGKNAKTLTPYLHLVQKGAVSSMEELQKRFSLEVVNKDFYNSIALLYTKLVGGQRKKGNSTVDFPGLLKIHGKASQSIEHQEFAVRLIGRLVFCWFLREKKSTTGTSLIPDSVLSAHAANNPMYYHKVLEPLFFELLNQKLISRKEPFKKEPFSSIPYLNGGLFSPQKGANGDYYEYSETTEGGALGVVDVPDSWLQEFTELLETYNFTVDENTSQDVELSVDPEMLGRIFENLLAEINPETGESARKSTGSFYTPREVVEYMVDRSLVYFLANKTNIDEPELNALISYGLEDDELHPRTQADNKAIVDALSKLTILDPACGSGAYPIGILQKVVYILQQVDPDAKYWLEKQIGSVSPELRRHLEKQYEAKNYDYLRKLGVIRESIFGVDIQAVATEIARLRCFLTLIVEESVDDNADNRGIEALPNLDFKFVTANSLISLPEDKEKPASEQQGMFEDTGHIDELRRIRDNYFGANPEEKLSLQAQFNSLQTDMVIKNIDEYKGAASKRYNALSRWRPFEHKMVDWFDAEWMFGTKYFDIVLANPPYLGEKGHADLFTKIRADGLSDFYTRKVDLFYFFFHHSLNLTKNKGVISFITTNYYPTANGAKKLRKDFYDRTTVKELINFNELKIFESALGQHNMITILQKNNGVGSYNTSVTVCKSKGLVPANLLSEVLMKKSSTAEYYESKKEELFDGDQYYIRFHGSRSNTSNIAAVLDKVALLGTPITSICNVNVGLYTGADKVSANYIKKYHLDAEKGEGIFVLTKDEYANLNLSAEEKKICVPFFKNSDINRYYTKEEPDKYLIDFSFPNFVDYPIATYPNLLNHLEKYKIILENRESNDNGLRAVVKKGYWWLYTKRKLDFSQEKIVAPQRSPRNTFGYNHISWHASADVYFITSKDSSLNLKYILGLLNSKLYYVWLYNRGKRKGETLELYQTPLSELPVKLTDEHTQTEMVELVDSILAIKKTNPDATITDIEQKIDQLVYRIFDLNSDEINLVETNA